ncbi:hypothetical protein NCCP1664_13420 [Zafaria cholistanensis]|uniref:Uncharacterized protein n=1 Tax=Zafaria cholistanensis TaxID=1682741 RepID=A0A5A7NQ28_9MICC|nr:hypothetical protein [Zafaria cholistanensis]GER22845.1 hypothetical protein NCCP1664_13420 [Zafaria cholistanensis]
MEILFWVLVPLLVLTLGWWWLARVRARNSAEVAAAVGPEAAVAASALLNAETHRAVYRNLGQDNFLGAVQEFRNATGLGVKQCIVAVRSLQQYPQVFRDRAAQEPAGPEPAGPAADTPSRASAPEPPVPPAPAVPAVPASAPQNGAAPEPSEEALTIPDDWTERFGSAAGRTTTSFKITAETAGATQEFSSDDLPPAEHDQFLSLMRDHDLGGAAALFARHSGLDEEAIRQLLESAPTGSAGGEGEISEVTFEGEGPNGRISFSAGDLPAAERRLFLEHLGSGRLDEAARIISARTGLPHDAVRGILSAFGKQA